MKRMYLPSLYIKGFKSIDEMNLGSLSSINLIAGDNNVGKSTVLEAIYTFATNGSPEVLLQMALQRMNLTCNLFRRNNSEGDNSQLFLQFFNGWEFRGGKSIILRTSDSNETSLTLCYTYIEESTIANEIITKRTYYFHYNDNENFESEKGILIKTGKEERFFAFSKAIKFLGDLSIKSPVQFIHTSLSNKSINSLLWDNIALTGLEKYVVEALRIIEPDIENLAFIEESFSDNRITNRVPYVTLNGKSGRFPLSIMGDGMNRILSIILGLVSSKDGICLIDEIENGIYYKRQPELWNIICHLVDKLNIQLFATTHSLDCIRSFSDSDIINAQLIRLEHRKSGIKPICYNLDELRIALDNDIELR